jgi:hypothetical protein
MTILRATRDIRKVSLWLGHASIRDTRIYNQADPTDKMEILQAITPPALRRGRFQAPDQLLALRCQQVVRPDWAFLFELIN